MPGSASENPANDVTPQTHPPVEICIAEVSDPETLNTYSLVLSAANISHRVDILQNSCMNLFVSAHLKERALYEIDAYDRENTSFPVRDITTQDFQPIFKAMAPLLMGALLLMYNISGDWQVDAYWFDKGAGDSRAVLENHEYFRLITALTLHADFIHVLNNCIFGLFLLHFFLQLTGNGIGLLTLLITAASANFLNILIHGPGHLFVGFSTATFSVIGMLCTINFIGKTPFFRFRFLMPVMAGLALLAFLGSSGERTDLGSHLFGLVCGLVAGNLARLPGYEKIRKTFITQFMLGLVALAIVWGSWMAALSQ